MEKSVLIVEDSATQAKAIARMFTQVGFTHEIVSSHIHAIEKIGSRYFDLVLIDVFLEEVNSLDHIHEYKSLKPSLPIAIMTAGNHSESDSASDAINRARRARVDFVLAKPFKIVDLQQISEDLMTIQANAPLNIEPGIVFLR